MRRWWPLALCLCVSLASADEWGEICVAPEGQACVMRRVRVPAASPDAKPAATKPAENAPEAAPAQPADSAPPGVRPLGGSVQVDVSSKTARAVVEFLAQRKKGLPEDETIVKRIAAERSPHSKETLSAYVALLRRAQMAGMDMSSLVSP